MKISDCGHLFIGYVVSSIMGDFVHKSNAMLVGNLDLFPHGAMDQTVLWGDLEFSLRRGKAHHCIPNWECRSKTRKKMHFHRDINHDNNGEFFFFFLLLFDWGLSQIYTGQVLRDELHQVRSTHLP